MARNQKSWGLKFVLASIVLLFCLAVTTVEGRSVPLLAQLTPENTSKTNSKNKAYVGQAFAYLANRGRDFRASILVAINIDPKQVTNVQLYDLVNKELINGTSFSYIDEGYFALSKTIDADTNAAINLETVAVYVYLKAVGTKRPALSGTLVNNAYSHLVSLRADQVVTSPSGVSKNVGLGTVFTEQAADGTWTVTAVVNHDLDQKVTAISLHAPAASNTENTLVVDIPTLDNAGKIVSASISSDVAYYLATGVAYIQIKTSKNPTGALRGQVVPTTNIRSFTPTFPNTATQGSVTFLPDGSSIFGDVTVGLRQGGARNLTGNTTDPRVAEFSYNTDTLIFNNDFRFKLPVTLRNKYSIRGFRFVLRAAADASETAKYNIGIRNFASGEVDPVFSALATTGRRAFTSYVNLFGTDSFPIYLSPGGVSVNINGAALTSELFVDLFYGTYYINNAYANNIVKSIFYTGSNLYGV